MIKVQQTLKSFINMHSKCNQYVSNFSLKFLIAFPKDKEIRKLFLFSRNKFRFHFQLCMLTWKIPQQQLFVIESQDIMCSCLACTHPCTSIALLVNCSVLYFSLNVSVLLYNNIFLMSNPEAKQTFSGNPVPCCCSCLATRYLNLQ